MVLDLVSKSGQLLNNENLSLVKENSNSKEIKLWHLALLIGIPSASIVGYLCYRYYNKKDRNVSAVKPTKGTENSKLNESKNVKSTFVPESNNQKKVTSQLDKAVEKKNLGNQYFQDGVFDLAVKCYTEAIEACPLNDKEELPKFYQNRAAAYENLKEYEKVVEDCTNALKIDPFYMKALTRRAKSYENINMLNEAFEDLTTLCILQKFSNSSMLMADKLVKKIGEKMAKEIFANRNGLPISQHFVTNFYIGLNNDVTFNNKEFYEKCKENETSVMKEALDQFNSGNYTECIELLTEEIVNKKQFVLDATNLRGSLYMLKCQYKEAKQDFDFVLNHSEASKRLKSNTYIKLTALNLQNGQEDDAFVNYERAIELDNTNEDIYCNRAQVFAMKGKFEDCFADFDKCLELNSQNKIAKIQKAFFEFRQFYAQFSMYAQATNTDLRAAFENSTELKKETIKLESLVNEFSDIPEAYNLYAQILSEQENYEKADKFYKISLEKDPTNAALMVQRALNVMTWKNDFQEPIEMLNEAIRIDNTCEFAYETLATIEIQRGNLSQAIELFEKAIQLTRSEDSMTNLCCMLIGSRTQNKILGQLSGAQVASATNDFTNSILLK